MSYKSLLFCPDEKTARLVTQVLSELEFTVELTTDAASTAQRLASEHFDAIVADIQNEQDAALLFKSARDSAVNHSSLSVAVVEGQTGVAKAFRIGANLVLTKPINIEQSKGTLRVARGLLKKKSEARPAESSGSKPASTPASPSSSSLAPAIVMAIPKLAPAILTPAPPVSSQVPTASSSPQSAFSMLEVEKEPEPTPEPAEAALIESMNDRGSKATESQPTWAPALKGSVEPIAATSSGAAAAVAPALEKAVPELKTAAPLASHEAITSSAVSSETFEAAAVPVPSFAYGQDSGQGLKKFLKTAVMLVLFAAGGYLAYQKFQLGQDFQSAPGSARSNDNVTVENPAPTVKPASSTTPAAQPSPAQTFPDLTPSTDEASTKPSPSSPSNQHTPTPDTIEVQELASTPEPKITVSPKPLVVKTESAKPAGSPILSQVAPPALNIAANSEPSEALSNIVSTNSAPTPRLGALKISQGLSQGLLVKKVPPVYPASALQLRKQGTVELLATVSKDGSIARVQVMGGDPLFAKSAADAVRQWKYRPYLLNGEPVEIQTQITVIFNLPR